MKNIPNEQENKIIEELFLAIFFNDVEKVIDFKNRYPELYAMKNHFQIDGCVDFDLINLTFFNKTIWKSDDWNEDIKPLVEKNRQRTEDMLVFWLSEFHFQNMQRKIEYNQYCDYFFCDDPNDPDANEEVILDPISYFLEKGFREIDLRLYNRVECFDFEKVTELLEQGAKSNVDFYEDEPDSSAFERVGTECAYLSTCHIIPEFKVFEEKGYKQDFDITEMFGRLIGLAAYEEMYYLLDKYLEEE
jgi:hypothetical protein